MTEIDLHSLQPGDMVDAPGGQAIHSGASMGLTVIPSYEDDEYFSEPFFMSEELNSVHGLGGPPPVIPTGFKEDDPYLKMKNDIKSSCNQLTILAEKGWKDTWLEQCVGPHQLLLHPPSSSPHDSTVAQTVHDVVRPSHFEVIPASSMSPHEEQTFYWVVTSGLHPGIFPGIDDARVVQWGHRVVDNNYTTF
ncbi:hypothetical protein ARMGADRAFT_1029445 [Armillaria gallica]|uniref:Uncharacterized protein n=1 Tax=Armillaria gallica TaxID=47427 RepID=A0A2H3DGG0_ARMGA|nr:hypothetical protein ARMGADRAFT_1029445 [Armillaria gallica]